MRYKYEAKTKEGEQQVGFVEAGARDAAIDVLSSHGLFILKIEEAEKVHWYDRLGSYFRGVKRSDMVVFTRQFATLLESRLPLNKALRTLEEQTENPTLREAVTQIAEDIDSGLAFSQALERQSEIFSPFFVSMIRSAEVTGNVDQVAGFLADYAEREAILVSKARSALIYPAIIVILFLVVAFIIVTVVFPQIKPVFEQANVKLPFFAGILLGIGDFLGKWWMAVLLGLFVFVFMALDYIRTPEGRAMLDDLKVRLPIVKKVYLPLTITRFANAAAVLLRGGVPVAQAIEITGETVDNSLYKELLHDVSQRIREGISLSEALAEHHEYFPALVSQMVAVGETTGRLDQVLSRVANFYGQQSDTTVSNLVELIQPVLMIVIGIMVGLLFASILVPLYSLTSTI